MSNHIKAKFLGFNYGEISKEAFANMIPELIEALRSKLPNHGEQRVQSINFNVSDDNIDTKQEFLGREPLMVDAEGLWGVRIGNRGIALSTGKYVEFNETMRYFEELLDTLVPILKISHFSQVSLRNINLFKETEGEPNSFVDIKEGKHWGRQEIESLSSPNFLCAGAATKHIYYSTDYLSQLQLASGVVMEKQSYIPQNEWHVWKLRGEVPVLKEPHLMIDISGIAYQAPANEPTKQNILTEYSWDMVSGEFYRLHDLVNRVYTDITKD